LKRKEEEYNKLKDEWGKLQVKKSGDGKEPNLDVEVFSIESK